MTKEDLIIDKLIYSEYSYYKDSRIEDLNKNDILKQYTEFLKEMYNDIEKNAIAQGIKDIDSKRPYILNCLQKLFVIYHKSVKIENPRLKPVMPIQLRYVEKVMQPNGKYNIIFHFRSGDDVELTKDGKGVGSKSITSPNFETAVAFLKQGYNEEWIHEVMEDPNYCVSCKGYVVKISNEIEAAELLLKLKNSAETLGVSYRTRTFITTSANQDKPDSPQKPDETPKAIIDNTAKKITLREVILNEIAKAILNIQYNDHFKKLQTEISSSKTVLGAQLIFAAFKKSFIDYVELTDKEYSDFIGSKDEKVVEGVKVRWANFIENCLTVLYKLEANANSLSIKCKLVKSDSMEAVNLIKQLKSYIIPDNNVGL